MLPPVPQRSTDTSNKAKPIYLIGILCFIPLLGAFVGVVLLLLGIVVYRDKWLSIIGAFGIAFTVIIYSVLFYEVKHGDSFKQGFTEISQMQLNSLIRNVEFYKIQHGDYPDSLKQLLKDDPLAPITDALQLSKQKPYSYYNYKKIGSKYLLFSSVPDGIPNTSDDLFPKITVKDTSKIGWIKSAP